MLVPTMSFSSHSAQGHNTAALFHGGVAPCLMVFGVQLVLLAIYASWSSRLAQVSRYAMPAKNRGRQRCFAGSQQPNEVCLILCLFSRDLGTPC